MTTRVGVGALDLDADGFDYVVAGSVFGGDINQSGSASLSMVTPNVPAEIDVATLYVRTPRIFGANNFERVGQHPRQCRRRHGDGFADLMMSTWPQTTVATTPARMHIVFGGAQRGPAQMVLDGISPAAAGFVSMASMSTLLGQTNDGSATSMTRASTTLS